MTVVKSNWAANREPQQQETASPEKLRSGFLHRYVAGHERLLCAYRISKTL